MEIERKPRRTKEEIYRELNEIVKIQKELGKFSIREMFYILLSRSLIPTRGYNYNGVQEQVNKLRYTGEIPFDSVTDSTNLYGTIQWNSFEEQVNEIRSSYRSNWNSEFEEYVEVWIEKEALAVPLSEIVNWFGVFTSASSGVTKISQIHSFLNRVLIYNRPTTILYLGDFDPTGLHIDQVIQNQIDNQMYGYKIVGKRRTLEYPPIFKDRLPPIKIRRIAVTEDQISRIAIAPHDSYSREGQTAKKSDPNYMSYKREFKDKYGDNVWELKAIPRKELQSIVYNALAEYRPVDRINELIVKDQEEVKIIETPN
jgi:hypothetical protein